MEVWWFSRAIAHHPYAIVTAILIFSSTCLIAPLTIKKFPDFSDPQLGFESRGTPLAQRLIAWQNLLEASKPRGQLVDNPLEYYYYTQQRNQQSSAARNDSWTAGRGVARKRPKSKKKGKKYQKQASGDETEVKDKWEELLELNNKLDAMKDYKSRDDVDGESFFCNSPSSAYARVVIGRRSEDTNLWSMEGVLAQCYIDAELRANSRFPSLCQTRLEPGRGDARQKCCRSWSPANYVALLSNRTSCLGVTESDLGRVESLLKRCVYFYKNRHLTSNCAEDFNCQRHVPAECYAHDAAYHLLHYLLDVEFISDHAEKEGPRNGANNSTLKYAMLILPIAASSATLDFYNGLDDGDGPCYGKFCVEGMQLGLKSTLFDKLLVSDSALLLVGFGFVTICIWAYTSSLLLTVTTIVAVIFSLGISYAFYTLVLRIKFFPFMNLLAIVVAVGIGADDAFIYCKIWERGKEQKKTSNNGLVKLVQETMKHAVPSMFVTSLTTAVAFFASVVSNVTAINCFSLFSGMTVIANFFLMITWLPACVVISEQMKPRCLSPANFIARKVVRPARLLGVRAAAGFNELLARTVLDLRWCWLSSLGVAAAACCIVVFQYPGLRPPDSADFQLFESSHPFEKYDLVYSRKFWFERHETIDGDALPLRFVWGIKPVDNGNYLDPGSTGSPEWDDTFDASHPESQLWLKNFCHSLRAQPFYRDTLGPLLSNCFIELLYNWMQRRCEDPIDSRVNHMPCCEKSKFPYNASTLQRCAAEANAELHRTPSYLWFRSGVSAGLKFLNEPNLGPLPASNETRSLATTSTPKIRALVVEYDSIYNYSLSFASMDRFFRQVETWMQDQLKSAPSGMRGGWFVSRLEFYELQRTLYEGTLWAMGVSLVLALAVLAFATFNPLVSLYAIVTIGAAITVTVAGLILLGWKLNVLESVAVSTAIGLTVDFSLHYVVSYTTCTSKDREDRVRTALAQMGGPTLMASLTSGAAGALMLPSSVLAYIQIGVFLLLVMGVSWTYATFFLCPMLAVAGPSSRFAQFRYPRLNVLWNHLRRDKKSGNAPDANERSYRPRRSFKGRGMWSESTLSTSSTVCQFHCNEVETLARPPPSPSPSLPPSPSSALLQ